MGSKKTEWRPVRGYDDDIRVSDSGRVFNRTRGTFPKLRKTTAGYMSVCLRKDGKGVQVPVHRLVCTAFHGDPPSDEHEVDHINRVRDDNRQENLEWVTHAENIRRAKAVPLLGIGCDGSFVVLRGAFDSCMMGVDGGSVRKCVQPGRSNRAGGFRWTKLSDHDFKALSNIAELVERDHTSAQEG